MLNLFARRSAILAALLLVGLAGCGSQTTSSHGPTASSDAPTSTAPAKLSDADINAKASDRLDGWTDRLIPILVTARKRGDAHLAGNNAATDARLTRKLYRDLTPVMHWGRDARKAFFDVDPPTPVTRATTAAGDAWAKWAIMLHTKQAISYDKGAKIADRAVDAVRRTQRASRLAGRDIPPAWQTSSGR